MRSINCHLNYHMILYQMPFHLGLCPELSNVALYSERGVSLMKIKLVHKASKRRMFLKIQSCPQEHSLRLLTCRLCVRAGAKIHVEIQVWAGPNLLPLASNLEEKTNKE